MIIHNTYRSIPSHPGTPVVGAIAQTDPAWQPSAAPIEKRAMSTYGFKKIGEKLALVDGDGNEEPAKLITHAVPHLNGFAVTLMLWPDNLYAKVSNRIKEIRAEMAEWLSDAGYHHMACFDPASEISIRVAKQEITTVMNRFLNGDHAPLDARFFLTWVPKDTQELEAIGDYLTLDEALAARDQVIARWKDDRQSELHPDSGYFIYRSRSKDTSSENDCYFFASREMNVQRQSDTHRQWIREVVALFQRDRVSAP